MNYKTDFQRILYETYLDHLFLEKGVNPLNSKSEKHIPPTEVTNENEFDLKDKSDFMIQSKGLGSVTYINKFGKTVGVTDYEKLINSLPDSIQKGLKRCDCIVYSLDKKEFFILNELSKSKNEFDKESHAIHQLSESLSKMLSCDDLKNEIGVYQQKICVFSNRYIQIDSPDKMADSFGAIFNLINDVKSVQKENIPEISELGFEYYKSSIIELNDKVEFYS